MTSKADAVRDYVLAKDGNRPFLLEAAFVEEASLEMVVRTDVVSFPPSSVGREAIAETLVRQFNRRYENVFTFCIGARPPIEGERFRCDWLVVMSEKDDRSLRVGCGRYDWRFGQADDRVRSLSITIDAMEVASPASVSEAMAWASALPYPWCELSAAVRTAPDLPEVHRVLGLLSEEGR